MMDNDSYEFILNRKIEELIKFVLYYCRNKYSAMMELCRKLWKVRREVMRSTVRVYYLSFLAQKDIVKV